LDKLDWWNYHKNFLYNYIWTTRIQTAGWGTVHYWIRTPCTVTRRIHHGTVTLSFLLVTCSIKTRNF